MRLRILSIALLVASLHIVARAENPEQKWIRGFGMVARSANDSYYVRVDLSYTLGSAQAQCTYTYVQYPDGSRLDISAPGYDITEVVDQNRIYTKTNSARKPLRILELEQGLERIFSIDSLAPGEQFESTSDKFMVEGRALQCVLKKKGDGSGLACFDTANGLPYFARSWPWQFEFSKYAPLGQQFYPQHMRVFEAGSAVVDARLTLTTEVPPRAAELQVPEGAVERTRCENDRSAKPVTEVAPIYPVGKRSEIASVVIQATVGTDGHVNAPTVLISGSRWFDEAALDAVKRWRFQPAQQCGNPVASDVLIPVNFFPHR